MLELAKKTKVKKFIYASSSSVYGVTKYFHSQLNKELIALFQFMQRPKSLGIDF